ncbi:hypothetical protein OL548_24360 [Lysinibacillus sp. MHQ-1]|nr:hypothetical protein OL548_24360 [Lysinibacillus sp. MHQ-1]
MIKDRGAMKWTSMMLPEHLMLLKKVETRGTDRTAKGTCRMGTGGITANHHACIIAT